MSLIWLKGWDVNVTYPKILNGTLAFSWYFCPVPTSPTKSSGLVKFWLKAEIPLFCYLYFLKYLFICVGMNYGMMGYKRASVSQVSLCLFNRGSISPWSWSLWILDYQEASKPCDLPTSGPSELGYRSWQGYPACSMGAGIQTPVLYSIADTFKLQSRLSCP